jgi:hypothetical protein
LEDNFTVYELCTVSLRIKIYNNLLWYLNNHNCNKNTVFKCTKICGNEIGIKWPVWVIYAEVIFQSGKTHCRGVNAVKFKRLNHFNFYWK